MGRNSTTTHTTETFKLLPDNLGSHRFIFFTKDVAGGGDSRDQRPKISFVGGLRLNNF
jgi:hypothetical protein